jgi:hypothetical protein
MRLVRLLLLTTFACGVLIAGLFFAQNTPTSSSASLLGAGNGVDHVAIGVRDLGEAKKLFQQLGFTVGQDGVPAAGTANAMIHFKNHRHTIELISVQDREKIDADWARGLDTFLSRFEGPVFVGLDTSSASTTSAFLRARGVDATAAIPVSFKLPGTNEVS